VGMEGLLESLVWRWLMELGNWGDVNWVVGGDGGGAKDD